EQEIEALAMLGEQCVAAFGGPIGRGPVGVREAVFSGRLDHAVQRDVFDDLERSHASIPGRGGCRVHPDDERESRGSTWVCADGVRAVGSGAVVAHRPTRPSVNPTMNPEWPTSLLGTLYQDV